MFETFQAEWVQLKAEWAGLCDAERQAQWERYTLAIDIGAQGLERFHRILWPIYEVGEGG